MPWLRNRSGRRGRPTMTRGQMGSARPARMTRLLVVAARLNWHRPTCCWPRTSPATPPASYTGRSVAPAAAAARSFFAVTDRVTGSEIDRAHSLAWLGAVTRNCDQHNGTAMIRLPLLALIVIALACVDPNNLTFPNQSTPGLESKRVVPSRDLQAKDILGTTRLAYR